MYFACLGSYSEMIDVNEDRGARLKAEKAKQQILRAEINTSSNACLYLMTSRCNTRSSYDPML